MGVVSQDISKRNVQLLIETNDRINLLILKPKVKVRVVRVVRVNLTLLTKVVVRVKVGNVGEEIRWHGVAVGHRVEYIH